MVHGDKKERTRQALLKALELLDKGKCSTTWTTGGFIPTIDVGLDIINICDTLWIVPYKWDVINKTITLTK